MTTPVLLSRLEVPRRAHPWSPGDILAALDSLTRTSGLLAPVLALALPVEVVPTMAVSLTPESVTFRGRSIAYPPSVPETTVDAVLTLVHDSHESSDTYSDPTATPATWARLLRSGARNVLFSATELFGLPFLAAELTLDPAALYAYLHATLTSDTAPGDFCSYNGTVFEAVGEATSVVLTPLSIPARPPRPNMSKSDLGNHLAYRLDGELLGFTTDGDYTTYEVRVADLVAVVPAALYGGSAAIGYRGDLVPTGRVDVDLPEGWVGLGPATDVPGWVALHQESRTRALLTLP